MSKWDDIKKFSKRTGITDPALDAFIKGDEVGEKTIERYSRETGLSDPVLDHFAKQLATRSNVFYGIDWDESLWPSREPYDQISRAVHPDSEARWQWIPVYPDYSMHAAQRDFMEEHARFRYGRNRSGDHIPRGYAVMTGISAWASDEAKPKPDGEAIDLVAIDKARIINSADNGLVEQLEANINRLHDGFRSQFYGGFGGMICHATREHDNYVDGRWRETPLRLPEPTSQTSENWEDPLFPVWLETYR